MTIKFNVVIFVTEHLHCRYEILRDKLMLEMLKHHIGEGMWTVLSEGEQHERFIQLKMRVQRLRKDDKLDGAEGLPGAGALYSATLLALMGLSRIGEENQRLEEAEKIKQMEKEGHFYQLVLRYFTLFEANFISRLMFIFRFQVEPRYNERPRGWKNLFTITRFRYIKVLFHIFSIIGVKKIVRYTEDFLVV